VDTADALHQQLYRLCHGGADSLPGIL
jgi:hypothetical protein